VLTANTNSIGSHNGPISDLLKCLVDYSNMVYLPVTHPSSVQHAAIVASAVHGTRFHVLRTHTLKYRSRRTMKSAFRSDTSTPQCHVRVDSLYHHALEPLFYRLALNDEN
jgi:hypothetical protein